MKNKVKYYRDPNRNQPPKFKQYTPQYQLLGFSPEEVNFGVPTDGVMAPQAAVRQSTVIPAVSRSNPRVRSAPMPTQSNVPFANVSGPSPIGKGRLPNVGNNVETWVSVDGNGFSVVDGDETQLDSNHPIIDNNDDDIQNYQDIPQNIPAPPQPTHELVEDDLTEQSGDFLDIDHNEYLLVVKNAIIGSGPFESIENEVKKLVFGEHELNKHEVINEDDLIVLKRVKIKIGVFLDK